MPTFRYQAYDSHGELAEGGVEAASEAGASDLLWARGLTPFRLQITGNAKLPWWRRDLTSKDDARAEDLTAFTREFATLHAAEVPLDDALRILSEQTTSAKVRELSEGLLADILDGATLSDAMQKRPRVFTTEYVSVVRAGEIGARVGEVLDELASLLERRAEIRAEIRSALTYPAIMIGLSLISVAIVVGGLIPSIAPILAENGRPMPAAINAIVSLQAHWPEIIFALTMFAGLCFATFAFVVTRPSARMVLERRLLQLPIYGSFALRRETARFARTLGTLLRAGVPLLQAASSARTVIDNSYVGAGMDRAIDAIREGVALHRALRAETVFPAVAIRIISIGEEAGKLDRMLTRLAVMFEQQTQHSVARFMKLLTPALTLAIAIVIGGLIMTVISTILSINDIAFR
ncbi:type II secretion system F family protein [Bradyrhizobium sp. INPA03-11B]|uniref:type II secretion system F family protein n=1 Tax=Bradyrhizobium sp. INPA03-11B TaxID=418598 RepID=UPI00338DE929